MLELFVGVISVATSDSMASLSLDIFAAGQMATESELICLLADRHPRTIATVRNFKKHREDAGRSLVCHAAYEHAASLPRCIRARHEPQPRLPRCIRAPAQKLRSSQPSIQIHRLVGLLHVCHDSRSALLCTSDESSTKGQQSWPGSALLYAAASSGLSTTSVHVGTAANIDRSSGKSGRRPNRGRRISIFPPKLFF